MSDDKVLSLLQSIAERLTRVELAVATGGPVAVGSAGSSPAGGSAGPSENVANFQALVDGEGAKFIAATKALGKKAVKAATFIAKTLKFNAELVAKADTCRAPTTAELQDFGKKLRNFANKGLRAQFPHRNMEKGLAEVFNALAALLHPTPVQTVKNAFETMQFYTNQVLTDAKGKEDKQPNATWVKAAEAFLTGFRQFCVPSMRGLKWKGKDDPTGDAPSAAIGGAKEEAAPEPVAKAPAPAPAPASKVKVSAAKPGLSKAKPAGGGLAGLFAEIGGIDQSSGKTAGLKHVSDKQKTYKNRSLVKSSKVSTAGKKKGGAKKMKAAKPKKVLPPKCEYDRRQRTWFIENQVEGRINVNVVDTNDKVYLYRNGDCVVQITGRIKALNVVNCKKTQVSFEDLLAVAEINNCESVKVQSLGKCPAMTIDKTNGCQVYLSRSSLDCNFVCAQSSEMNVNFPTGPEGDDEEWLERPIPEQFQHKLNGTNLASEVSDLYSH